MAFDLFGSSTLGKIGNAAANYAVDKKGLGSVFDQSQTQQNPFAQFAQPNENDSSGQDKISEDNTNKKLDTLISSLSNQQSPYQSAQVNTTPTPIAEHQQQKSSGIGSLIGMVLAAL